jgi:heme/copper-type cytochrome/quinol oxidase subunit 2
VAPAIPALFWIAIVLVATSQVLILRSTVRAMRAATSAQARRGIEWAYAVVPAVALVAVLVATWGATRQHLTRLELEARASQTAAP